MASGQAQKTFKAFERDNRMFVKGKTMIDHAICLRNNLSLREYVILVTIMEIRESSQKNEGITYGKFWIKSGVKPAYVQRAFAKLKAKELLYKDDKGLVQVSEAFKSEFKNNANFEDFWNLWIPGPPDKDNKPTKIRLAKGAKAAAMRMYDKAIRIKKHEDLCKAYIEYNAYCDNTGRFKKDTSSWLNPASGYIDTEWIAEIKKEEEKQNTAQSPEALDYDFFNPENK